MCCQRHVVHLFLQDIRRERAIYWKKGYHRSLGKLNKIGLFWALIVCRKNRPFFPIGGGCAGRDLCQGQHHRPESGP
jgi:hypothetical protein